MEYNLVGIDTIRFSVSRDGFNQWLKGNTLGKVFKKVRLASTPLTNERLVDRLRKEPSLRVIKINNSYANKLSNYIIVG